MKVRGDSDIDTMALRQALEALKTLPGGPLPEAVPQEQLPMEGQMPMEDPMQMAQAGPSQQDAQSAIDRMLGRNQPEQTPEPSQLPAELPPEEQPESGGLFGGKKTRQQQLDEELRRQMGQ